jgi:diguanylate cyclase (GGDEF)-like protein
VSRLHSLLSGFLQPVPAQPEWRGDEAWAFARGGLVLLAVSMLAAIVGQALFSYDSLYSNGGYATLMVASLVTAWHMRKESRRMSAQKFVQRMSAGVVAGSLLVGFIPGTQPYVFLLVQFSTLLWFWGSSATIFPFANAIGWFLLGLYSLGVMISGFSPFANMETAIIAATLCGVFALIMAYGYRQILAFILAHEREHEATGEHVYHDKAGTESSESAGPNVKWAAILKATTLEMAGTHDADTMYKKMLGRIKAAIPSDIVVLGRLQNRVMFPVLMWDKNGQRNVNGSLRMIWSLALLDELEEKKDVHAGLSDAALLDSFFDEGKVPFGYRLDIPFFSQKKLSGVVSLFRQKQEFNRYETDLASSIVFHGMFAHRSALIQNRATNLNSTQSFNVNSMTSTQAIKVGNIGVKTAANSPKLAAERETPAGVLASEEFIQKADSDFRQLEKSGKPVAVLLIEVDSYAKYADKYSERTLAQMFSQLSTLLQANLATGSLFGRYGKASFAVQASMDSDRAKHLAEQLRYLVQKRAFMMDGAKESITVSIGVASRNSKTLDFLSVLKRADIGLYKAKHGVGNTVHVNA